MITAALFAGLPGADLIQQGLEDVVGQRETIASLLVQIGSPRLGRCAVIVPVSPESALNADRRLYRLLAAQHGNEAHSRYNALIRQLVSFERALEQRISRSVSLDWQAVTLSERL